MSVLYNQPSGKDLPSDSTFIFCKGAPEGVLSKSTHYMTPQQPKQTFFQHITSTPTPISENFQELVSQTASRMAESGLRVLALAYRTVSNEQAKSIISSKNSKTSETDLTFVGLIGLIDPPKFAIFNL